MTILHKFWSHVKMSKLSGGQIDAFPDLNRIIFYIRIVIAYICKQFYHFPLLK